MSGRDHARAGAFPPDRRGTDAGGLPVRAARAGHPVAALEHEADVPAVRRSSRDHGQRLLTRPARQPALGTGRRAAPAERARAAAASPALATLLDDVAIHDDAQARAALDEAGARALATPDAVALQPGLPDHGAVLVHELVHVAQQRAGEAVVAHDDAAPGRTGEQPPDAEYTVADGRAAEDGHVLFPHGSSTLSPDARARLSSLVAGVSGPVTVDVHGYASAEGDPTFNRNLSAHRATAAAEALRELLPEAVVRVFARGETTAFGAQRGPNRRVGVQVHRAPATDPAAQPAGSPPVSAPAGTPAGTPATGPTLFPTQLSATLLDPPRLQPGWWRTEPTRPTPGFDAGAVSRKFALHGAQLSLGDLGALEKQYGFWYLRLAPHLGHSLTSTVLNIGVGNTVGPYLSREHPTAADVFQREIDTHHQLQGAFKTPVLTIDVLDVLRKRGWVR